MRLGGSRLRRAITDAFCAAVLPGTRTVEQGIMRATAAATLVDFRLRRCWMLPTLVAFSPSASRNFMARTMARQQAVGTGSTAALGWPNSNRCRRVLDLCPRGLQRSPARDRSRLTSCTPIILA